LLAYFFTGVACIDQLLVICERTTEYQHIAVIIFYSKASATVVAISNITNELDTFF